MANGSIKITELPESTSVSDNDIFIIENDIVTQRISFLQLINYIKEHREIVEYYIKSSRIGEENGVAPLDSKRKIPETNLNFGTTEGTIYDGALGKALSDIINTHLSDLQNPHSVTKEQVGLSNADNTSDISKPVSIRQQTAIDAAYTNANAYTDTRIAALINGAPSTLDTLKKLSDALLDNQDIVTILSESIGKKADQSELDTHASNDIIHVLESERKNWTEAYNQKHLHTNQTILDEITADSIQRWNNMAGQNTSDNKIISASMVEMADGKTLQETIDDIKNQKSEIMPAPGNCFSIAGYLKNGEDIYSKYNAFISKDAEGTIYVSGIANIKKQKAPSYMYIDIALITKQELIDMGLVNQSDALSINIMGSPTIAATYTNDGYTFYTGIAELSTSTKQDGWAIQISLPSNSRSVVVPFTFCLS